MGANGGGWDCFIRREMAGGEWKVAASASIGMPGGGASSPSSSLSFLSLVFPCVVFVHGVAWLADVDRRIDSPQNQSPAPALGHVEARGLTT